jgi:hypothetical protein
MAADEEKILNTFVKDGRLVRMPARQGKKLVILRWLVQRFEPGVSYPEHQVNAILQEVDPDYAMLRRYLVDAGLMQRDQGIYWRTPASDPPAL